MVHALQSMPLFVFIPVINSRFAFEARIEISVVMVRALKHTHTNLLQLYF